MTMKWERSEAIVGQRINISQIKGFFGKKVKLADGEMAITEKDGKALKELDKGSHKVSGMFSREAEDVVFIDVSPKVLKRDVQGLWTSQDKEINASLEMTFRVTEPEKIRKLMMGRRDLVTIEDIWKELEKDVVSSGLAPVVKRKNVDDLTEEKKVEKEVRVAVEVEARKKFEVFGLDLISFSVRFILPEDYQEYLRKRGELKAESEESRIQEEDEKIKAVHEREIAEITGEADTREKALDDAEKERIRREAELGIEEEETQQDMKDALEGLRLKELKDRQRDAAEQKRKDMGLEALREALPGRTSRTAEEKYDILKRMMGETEKMFLNRKIDKEMYRNIMGSYEKEKAELEAKMKKK